MRGLYLLAIVAGCGHVGFDHDDSARGAGDASGCVAPAGAWLLEQVAGNGESGSTMATMSVPVVATTPGDLVVVAVQGQAPGVATGIADDVGSTYLELTGTSAVDVNSGDVLEIWYSPAIASGATQLTVTYTTTAVSIVMWEFRTPRVAAVDAVGEVSNQPSTTTAAGPPITTRCTGEIVIAALVSNGVVNQIASGSEFTNDTATDDNGWAHITDPHAPAGIHTAAWSTDDGSYCSSAAAFIVE